MNIPSFSGFLPKATKTNQPVTFQGAHQGIETGPQIRFAGTQTSTKQPETDNMYGDRPGDEK